MYEWDLLSNDNKNIPHYELTFNTDEYAIWRIDLFFPRKSIWHLFGLVWYGLGWI